jgi:hypothetical protein
MAEKQADGKKKQALLKALPTELKDHEAAANGSNRAGGTAAEIGGYPMRSLISALIAVSVLGLVAVPASAFDPKTFWEQQGRNLP